MLAVVALIVVVVGLVALNLSMRPDPEPEYTPPSDPLPERRYAEVLRTGVDAGAEVARAAVAATPAPRADEGGDVETDPAQEVDGCDHPLVPARRGEWREYRWGITTEDYVAEVRIQAERTRALTNGEREVTWTVRASSEGEPLSQIALVTRCRAGEDAEDPWFGILERAIGHRITRRTARWRWPAELARGRTFRGTATLDPSEADARPPEGVEGPHMLTVTRNHVVDSEVEVEVPAGTFRAWRVAYEERQAYGTHGETGTGTIWIAADVGMLRTRAENSRGVVQTIELVSMGR